VSQELAAFHPITFAIGNRDSRRLPRITRRDGLTQLPYSIRQYNSQTLGRSREPPAIAFSGQAHYITISGGFRARAEAAPLQALPRLSALLELSQSAICYSLVFG
jgi:hypothetical protein